MATQVYESETTGTTTVTGNAIEIVTEIFHSLGLPSPMESAEPASDEADDIVAALQARDALQRSSGTAVSLEDAIRAHGLDPADYGL